MDIEDRKQIESLIENISYNAKEEAKTIVKKFKQYEFRSFSINYNIIDLDKNMDILSVNIYLDCHNCNDPFEFNSETCAFIKNENEILCFCPNCTKNAIRMPQVNDSVK